MIYLDNASTTNKKPLSVKMAVMKAMRRKYCANPGRSAHNLSMNAGGEVFKTRALVSEFFNVGCVEHVIFTNGCTEALNTAIFGTIKKGGNVVITSLEHNSVARPLKKLEQEGVISLTIVRASENLEIDPKDIEKAIKPETYLVIVNHTSNVNGATQNIKKIGEICKQKNVLFMVDSAQSAGHQKIDMINDNIDIICSAGHKGLLGIQGVGVLCYQKSVEICPLKFGGTGTFSELLLPPTVPPESLEAGTTCTPNIFSLQAGIKYVQKNFKKINKKIAFLTKILIEKLAGLEFVTLYTKKDCYNGVVSITIKNSDSADVANYLATHNICVRSGLHCAPLAHETLGTIDGGTIRISISHYNKIGELKKLVRVLKRYYSEENKE